ncbi:hypothetical protein FQN54_006641 [Arachnomyces sp. PD_36]|nr:hypothetical protein FQN54_006641 [Arachnomyces sp. PD_36]
MAGKVLGYPAVQTSQSSSSSPNASSSSITAKIRNEKVIAAGNGVTVSIALTEPVLYLPGFDHNDPSTSRTAMLRGGLRLKVTKPAKIKRISLSFRGILQTEWPEGLATKRNQQVETSSIMNHTWPFFNAQFPDPVTGHGADRYYVPKPLDVYGQSMATSTADLFAKSISAGSSTNSLTTRDTKALSLQSNQSRSFGKGESVGGGPTISQRGYLQFAPGDYIYNFEMPIDSRLPESINAELGSVRYELEALIERSGAFRPNVLGAIEIPFIRTPAEGSLEQVEPIAISRNWDDQLHYDIIISGKSFPLGSQIPIAFKLIPLAKVECHRIKVLVTENIQYMAGQGSSHRSENPKKILLFEKRANAESVSTYRGSTIQVTAGGGIDWDRREAAARGEEVVNRNHSSLLGNLDNNSGVGPTEMEFNVQLPSCHEMKTKILLRLSRPDEHNPAKKRHFEISIDSPIHLLSCMATQSNIYLPAYTSPDADPVPAQEYACGCPGAEPLSPAVGYVPNFGGLTSMTSPTSNQEPQPISRSFTSSSAGLAQPPTAHIQGTSNDRVPRPMHLLRAPSFAPPAFDEVLPPPPLITPPPDYKTIVECDDPNEGLQDYFDRLARLDGEGDDDERGRGRVDVPLTPGARINRSMDVPRDWVRLENSETAIR